MFGINQWELLVIAAILASVAFGGMILFWIVRAAVRSANRPGK
jgi:hypothetical protein